MRMKNLCVEMAAIVACYLIIALPIAGATDVNIRLNGNVAKTVTYDPSNIVNLHVTYVKDPSDISWANVRIAVNLNSASMAHSIKKVYLYKCGSLSPTSCLQKTPEVFDTHVDTEIAWSDIAQSGSQGYPQEGSMLFVVKLENPEGMASWVGLWTTIKRQSYREFLFYRHELPEFDVHAKEAYLVEPIASYIENFNAIPFGWITKAAFGDALSITAIGGDDDELGASPPVLQSVEPSGREITVINKENYFVFPETSSGTAFPITLEQNPDFECGDRRCETSLGENSDTCCYDCGCRGGDYCDAVQGSPEEGACRSQESLSLDVVGTPTAEVEQCGGAFQVALTARVNSAPQSMQEQVNGVIRVADKSYTAKCTKSGTDQYQCLFQMNPTIQCGSGVREVGPNELVMTVTYNDGVNQVTRDLSEAFPAINIHYDCSCEGGYYCDSGTETCESEDAVSLGITELTSYLDSYTPGDTMDLTVRIFNPPTGTVLVSSSAGLNLSNGIVSPGTPSCTGPSEDFEYECSIPFSITGYQKTVNYRFYPNYLSFRITYNDGANAKTKTLTTEFGPVSIPSQDCGNGVCNVDESPVTCCQDCGCEMAGDYCDVVRGCSAVESISLSAIPYPREVEDCKTPSEVSLRATIANAPYNTRLDYKDLTVNYQPVPWKLECPPGVGGNTTGSMVFNCLMEVPPLDGCELPYYTVGPNELSFTISFPNGGDEQSIITKELNASFADVYVKPIPHIDGVCEASLGENGSTACVDCPCADDPAFSEGYYCEASLANPEGTCLPRSGISLVVEHPTTPVSFQSCEEINKFNVLMHVDNRPSSMDIENKFATVGGEAARYLSCSEERRLVSEGNGTTAEMPDTDYTLNCTIGIPPISTCSQGEAYNHSGNSISVVVSYENGEQGKVLQTLTADLPEINIYQSYRTLHDITEDSMSQMRGVLDRMMDIQEKMMDAVEKCMKMQMMVMLISIGLTLAMGLVGAGAFSDQEMNFNQRMDGFAQGVEAGGKVSSSLSGFINEWCETLQKQAQIEMKMQEYQMEKVKMMQCLDIAQHALDSGQCRGQEEACFDNIRSCMNFNDMNGILEDITSLSSGIGEDFQQMGGYLSDVAEAFGDGPWNRKDDRYQYLWLGVRGYTYYSSSTPVEVGNNDIICNYAGTEYGSQCRDTQLVVKYRKPEGCENALVRLTDSTGGSVGPGWESLCLNNNNCEVTLGEGFSSTDQAKEYILSLYCSEDTYYDDSDDLEESRTFSIAPVKQNTCMCTYEGNDFSGALKGTSGAPSGSSCGHALNRNVRISVGTDYLYKEVIMVGGDTKIERECKVGGETILKTAVPTNTNGREMMVYGGYEYWNVVVEEEACDADDCCSDGYEGYIRACSVGGGNANLVDLSAVVKGTVTGSD